MTRDEILAMKPGRELDALVGEYVFGFKRGKAPNDINGENGGTDLLIPPDPPGNFSYRNYSYPPKGRLPLWYHCKEWSTDIPAAFQAVEKADVLPFSIHRSCHANDPVVMGWTVNWCQDEYSCELCSEDCGCKGECEVKADTVPEAISKALLLIKLEEV